AGPAVPGPTHHGERLARSVLRRPEMALGDRDQYEVAECDGAPRPVLGLPAELTRRERCSLGFGEASKADQRQWNGLQRDALEPAVAGTSCVLAALLPRLERLFLSHRVQLGECQGMVGLCRQAVVGSADGERLPRRALGLLGLAGRP